MEIYRNGKVLLACFDGSTMVADNEGKTTSYLDRFWRTKTYVKPEDMIDPHYPPFNQPYQIAQSVLGGTWNEYNEVFLIQVGLCKVLNCWYCFVDPLLRQGKSVLDDDRVVGDWFSAEEVFSWWKNSGNGVLRISGGEPMLAPQFVIDMWAQITWEARIPIPRPADFKVPFLWIDTNLMVVDNFIELHKKAKRARHIMGGLAAICGCFKGFTEQEADYNTRRTGVLKKQLENAAKLIKTGVPLFFYIPDAILESTASDDISQFFNRLRDEVHPNAPLRTYVLQVKKYSSTEQEEWKRLEEIQENRARPTDIWQQLCRDHYPPELVWLPSHQVPMD